MLSLANEVAKIQGRLVLSTFFQKSHSSLVLNTEHNGGAPSCCIQMFMRTCKGTSSMTFQWRVANNPTPTINWPRMLKWYSSHPSRILICPIMHVMPIHISRICEFSFIRKKHITQKWDICAHFSANKLQKWTRFKKSLPYKSWCNDIRYGWNLCWSKILNTDRWLIPLFFHFPAACMWI